MLFSYKAVNKEGGLMEGEIEAVNVNEVLRSLSMRNLKPVSVEKTSSRTKNVTLWSSINLLDQIFLSKYLALMLKIGTGLIQALDILIEDFEKPAVRKFLYEVRGNLERGQPFYLTFEKYKKFFSDFYVNMVKAGEASGNLEKVFENLSSTLSREKKLRDEIKGALVYPIILLVGASAMLYFLVSYAIPKIADVFSKSGFEPPGFSRVVFTIGTFFNTHALGIFLTIVITIVSFTLLVKFSLSFKKLLSLVVARVPAVRELTKKIALQRFASTLSALIKAGLPLTDALVITADTVSNVELKEALLRISNEGLTKGLTVGEAFKRETTAFPRTATNLIAISEKAGHMEEVLDTLSDFYLGEIEGALKTLVSFLEPVMLFGIGIVIGVIALSIVLPIYQLTTSI